MVAFITVSKAAFTTMSPSVELSSGGDGGGVEGAALNGGNALSREFLDKLRAADRARGHKTKLTTDRITPLPDVTVGSEGNSVSTTTCDACDLLALEAIDTGRRSGRFLTVVVAVAELTVDALTPGENLTVLCEGGRVVLTTGDLDNTLSREALDELWLRESISLAAPIAMSELSITTITPGEYLTRCSEGSRVVLTTGDLHNVLALECLDKVWHTRGAPVTMSELTIPATAPRVHIAAVGEHNSVERTAGNLNSSLRADIVHRCW